MPGIIPLILILLATPAYGAGTQCPVEGDGIQWTADYCMSTLETDDEIPAAECISKELRRIFPDDCVAKYYYKNAMCELALSRHTITGNLQTCMDDRNFMGSTVKNKGVGAGAR